MGIITDDWIFQLHIKETTTKNKFLPTDFYWDQSRMVMTESYHTRRGNCCGNKCKHCPYTPKYKKGNTIIK
jgi:hypothetical protein